MEQPQDASQDRKKQAEKILKKYSWGGAGIGLLPFPLLDMAAVTALQLKLIHSLAQLYKVEFSENRVKALLAALLGSGTAIIHGSKLAGGLKLLPITAPFALFSCSGLSAVTTYAVGKVFLFHFATGGTLLDFDPEAMEEYYLQQLSGKRGRKTSNAEEPLSYAGIKP